MPQVQQKAARSHVSDGNPYPRWKTNELPKQILSTNLNRDTVEATEILCRQHGQDGILQNVAE